MAEANSTISFPIELYLRLVGAWPKSSYLVLRRIICFNLFAIFITFQYWYIIAYLKSATVPDLLDALSVTISDTAIFLKLIIIWCNYRMFRNILLIISDDWKSYALISQYKQLMMDKINVSSRISNYLLGINQISCLLYIVTALSMPDDTGEELSTNNRKLLFKMEIPFDVMASPNYEICIILQSAMQHFVVYSAAVFLALFAALALHVGGQINIMCQELAHFSMNGEKHTRRELKNLIIKHQQIIYLSNEIKYLFTYISFVQFLANILVLCFLGFINVTSLGTEEQSSILTKYVPYCGAIVFEAFVLCYTGEYLTSKGDNINQAIYNAVWYKLRSRESRSYLLFLMRSKKSLSLTAGKVVDLSLETFASMLKASASYISVLLAMY